MVIEVVSIIDAFVFHLHMCQDLSERRLVAGGIRTTCPDWRRLCVGLLPSTEEMHARALPAHPRPATGAIGRIGSLTVSFAFHLHTHQWDQHSRRA